LFVCASWKAASKGIIDIPVIAEAFPQCEIIVVGRGSEELRGYKNIRRIDYVESVEKLVDIYNKADVFVNVSRAETFGKVTAEALSCGTPIAAYNNTGTAELCREGCGELARDGDPQDMIKKVKLILSRGKEFYSDECVKWAHEVFSYETAMKKHIVFYNQVIEIKHGKGHRDE
jgi:glycosyltransferase involved in cell wall biosynthesis